MASLQSNLGAALLTQADTGGDTLDEAVDVLQAALDSPLEADERPGTQTNLGLALQARWLVNGRRDDLDAAVAALDAATAEEPDESPSWPCWQ